MILFYEDSVNDVDKPYHGRQRKIMKIVHHSLLLKELIIVILFGFCPQNK